MNFVHDVVRILTVITIVDSFEDLLNFVHHLHVHALNECKPATGSRATIERVMAASWNSLVFDF